MYQHAVRWANKIFTMCKLFGITDAKHLKQFLGRIEIIQGPCAEP